MSLDWTFRPANTAFATHAARWDRLQAAAANLPFLESAFIIPLLRHLGGQPVLALGHCGQQLMAAALLQQNGSGRWTTYQPSQLPLGAWVLHPDLDAVDAAYKLLRRLPGLALGLAITQIDPRFHRRPTDAESVQTLDYIDTAWVDVEGTYDDYWNQRGKNLRTNMRKQRTKLEADGTRMRFEVLTSPGDMAPALDDFGRLESASWKADSGTQVQADNAQGRFYLDMMRGFCALGRGQVWRLWFDDQVVAVDLCIEAGSTLVILKTAFDSSHRTVSPSFLLKQEAFRLLFDQRRIRRIEFYGRLMEWHTRWTEQSRTLYHANLYRWGWLPRLHQRIKQLRRPAEMPSPGAAEAAHATPASSEKSP